MIPLEEAAAWLASRCPRLEPETIPLDQAAGRVLAFRMTGAPLPPHAVAAIDGLAVRAAETEGASDYAPLPTRGTPIVAGAAMPPGADAVLPPLAHDGGMVTMQAAAGQGVTQSGHHADETTAIEAGTRLSPLHLVLLALLDHTEAPVIRRPRIALRPAPPKSGPDALGPLLHGLVATLGAVVATPPDLILLAGRSGSGPDDHGATAFETVFAHGLALRPGETTALGLIDGTPALLLPGDPQASATVFALLAAPAIRRMADLPEPPRRPATLARKIVSALGQQDAVRVHLEAELATPLAPAEGGRLAVAAAANGLVLVPEGSEGYPRGATVEVLPL